MPGCAWTEDEKQLLKQLTARRHGAVRIRRLGQLVCAPDGRARTVSAIAQQIRRMKLANPEASARSRRARQRPPPGLEVVQAAKTYLRLHGADIPLWHVCEKFAVTESWVRRALGELGIKRSWKSSVAHPLSKFKSTEFRRAVAARVKAQAQQRTQELLLRLQCRRQELLREQPGIGQRVCDGCNQSWPLTAEFFQAFPNGEKIYFLYACHLCAAARRRATNRTRESPRTRRLRLRLETRREEVLASEPGAPSKNCWTCWKPWPLTPEFWRASPTRTGRLCYDPRCRLCQNARRREAAKGRSTRQKLSFALLPANGDVYAGLDFQPAFQAGVSP